MTKEKFIKKYLPESTVSLLRIPRHWFYILKGFDHKLAQKGELKHQISRDEELSERLSIELHQTNRMKYFFPEGYEEFIARFKDKRCLEIGSGPFPDLAFMPIQDRVVIEPLLNDLRQHQIVKFGKTLFSGITCYSQNAESLISSLENSIDGFILCDNVLDHCTDPWAVLNNIGRYAYKGCILILWSDIWHYKGLSKEHRNIIKDKGVLEFKLKELGFTIQKVLPKRGKDESTTEYGCIAIKN